MAPKWFDHWTTWAGPPIGWRNVWNMRWRAPGQEVDQRGHAQRLCKKIAKHTVWTGKTPWIMVDGRSWWSLGDDQDGGWMSVSSGSVSPGWFRTKGRKTVVVVVLLLEYITVLGYDHACKSMWCYDSVGSLSKHMTCHMFRFLSIPSRSCKGHRSKTANIKILSANPKHICSRHWLT